MKFSTPLLLGLLSLGTATTALAQTPGTQNDIDYVLGDLRRYLIYVPAHAAEEPAKKWPLLVFLHGVGTRANNGDPALDLAEIRSKDIPAAIDDGIANGTDTRWDEFIVLSPQTANSWDSGHLNTLIDEIIAAYPVDTDRLIITGQSLGAFGTYNLLLNDSSKWAAGVPIAGNDQSGGSEVNTLKNIPLWIHHGTDDGAVLYVNSENTYNAISTAIGGAETTDSGSAGGYNYTTLTTGSCSFTTYQGAKHNTWTATYGRDDVAAWMLAQTLPGANAAPAVSLDGPDLSLGLEYGDTSALTASATDPDGSVSSIRVELDGALVQRADAASISIPDFFSDLVPGDYTIRLSAIDDEGRESISLHDFSIFVPPPPAGSQPIINNSTLNGSFENPASGTTTITDWQDALGTAGAIERIVNTQAKSSDGSSALKVGRNSSGALIGAAIRTTYTVSAGEKFYLSLNWRAEKNKWDKSDKIRWRLFTTSDDSATGAATEIASGLITGTDDKFYRPYSQTAVGTVGPSQDGKALWLEIAPDTAIANDELAFIDEVVLHVIGDPDSDGDGLTDSEEAALGTLPDNPDTDGDGLPDGKEVNELGSDPTEANSSANRLNDLLAYALDVSGFASPEQALPTLDGTGASYSFHIPSTAASDVDYTVEVSQDMTNWYRIAHKLDDTSWQKDDVDDATPAFDGIAPISVTSSSNDVTVTGPLDGPILFLRSRFSYRNP